MVKRICALLALVALLLLPCTALAATRVFDQAELLTAEEKQSLQTRTEDMRAAYNTDVILLTTDDAEGKESQIYCADFFEAMNLGVGDTQDGVLLCIDMDNRQIMLVTHGATVTCIEDAQEEAIYDAMYDYVVDGEYGAAFAAGLDSVQSFIADGPNHGQFTYDTETGLITGFAYPEEGPQILQSGIDAGYMLHDEANDAYYYYPNGVPQAPLTTAERLARVFSPGGVGLSGGLGLLSGFFARSGVKRNYNKPYKAANEYAFRDKGSLNLTNNASKLANRFVTTRVIPVVTHDDSGGRGGGGFSGGSGTFSSSSGGSFGGGGGRSF